MAPRRRNDGTDDYLYVTTPPRERLNREYGSLFGPRQWDAQNGRSTNSKSAVYAVLQRLLIHPLTWARGVWRALALQVTSASSSARLRGRLIPT